MAVFAKRPKAPLDIECYKDYFLVKLLQNDGSFVNFGMWPGQQLDIPGLIRHLQLLTIVTFNGDHYDLNMLTLALYGATTDQLKECNDDIIVRNMQPWEIRKKWGIEVPEWIDHIDIKSVSPGVRLSLKILMGRMHAPLMKDLPFVPGWVPGPADRFVLSEYCGNDLIGTKMLMDVCAERIALRESLSEKYGIDVRSKSDAQIAEAVINRTWCQMMKDSIRKFDAEQLGAIVDSEPYWHQGIEYDTDYYNNVKVRRRYVPDNYSFRYDVPQHIRYVTPQMQELLETVRNSDFIVRDKEEAIALGYYDPDDPDVPKIKTGVKIPPALAKRDIVIGTSKYRMGIGGLHSTEKSVSWYADDETEIWDIDVKSYYPSMILALGMYPAQLGPAFLTIFQVIYDKRLMSKSEAERVRKLGEGLGGAEGEELIRLSRELQTESDGLKIVLNGTFGKLFSKWSILFAPELGIRVTVTGQLQLLMLIEMFEVSGIQVVSANTDGIVVRVPKAMKLIAKDIVSWWENTTKMQMEFTHYRSIHMRDVNNYVAITTDGKAKRKGVYNQGGVLSGPQGKAPDRDICADAVVAYLTKGTPIEETVRGCTDIRKFLSIRNVTKGAIDLPEGLAINDGIYLGKAIRWYISGRPGYIGVTGTGDKVAGSQGATPIMNLPKAMPLDVDYGHCIEHAKKLLALTGARQ